MTDTASEIIVALLGTKRTVDEWGDLLERECNCKTIRITALKFERLPSDALDNALLNIEKYSDVIITSKETVSIIGERIKELEISKERFKKVSVFAIGNKTAKCLDELNVFSKIRVPKNFTAEGLLQEIGEPANRRFLLPRALHARDLLEKKLGKSLDVIHIYRTELCDISCLFDEIERIDYVVVGSSRIAAHFVQELEKRNLSSKVKANIIAVGAVTGNTLAKLKIPHSLLQNTSIEKLKEILK